MYVCMYVCTYKPPIPQKRGIFQHFRPLQNESDGIIHKAYMKISSSTSVDWYLV